MMEDTLTALIDQEENLAPVKNLEDLYTRLAQRRTIQRQMQQLETAYKKINERVRRLPMLPPLQTIQWAQSVRAMPNVVFLEVDTTGLYEDAEIIRIVVLDKHGHPLLDERVHLEKPLSPQIQRITGIGPVELQKVPYDIDALLEWLRLILRGKYVLSYNLRFDAGKLREAAQRAHLPEIAIVGEDLMAQTMSYFNLSSYPKLEKLCELIGQPLPPQPSQTAIDRAKGQIALLSAIANVVPPQGPGQTTNQGLTPDTDDEVDLDSHPF